MSDFAVVDASVAFKWLVEEEHSDTATALVRLWNEEGIQPSAPYLMLSEVANALHRRVIRGDLSPETAAGLMKDLLSMGVAFHDSSNLHVKALQLARRHNQSAVYDSYYLALAEELDCELWTADKRLYRSARASVDNLRWIGELVQHG